MISLKLPGRLEYRAPATRVVALACRLLPSRRDDFDNEVISAFIEAFNNVVVHSYASRDGELEVDIEPGADRLTIQLKDSGKQFDPSATREPDLDSLPESGFGLFIMRSFMDEIAYVPGAPNTLSMTKFCGGRGKAPDIHQ